MPEGSFLWGGASGTWLYIDPTNHVTLVELIIEVPAGQLGGDVTLRSRSGQAIYDGLRL